MDNMVTLERWQFWLLLVLSVYAVAKGIVLPLIQYLIYQSSQSTKRMLNEDLNFGLPSYAFANRQLWVDRIVTDPQVKLTIQETSGEYGSTEDALRQAKRYAAEIVPTFNVLFYFRIGFWLARKFLRMYYWIDVGVSSKHSYKEISKDSCVVMVSNHRSNFDPLLLIYLTSKTAPISYSAGEWALIAPFHQILHAIGFSIIRRNDASNPLYKKILERYVFLATKNCIPQGIFIEGALSRDGFMQPLKLGLLNYVIKAYNQGECKDIVFIPCALNYDRIPEDKTLVKHQKEGFKEKGPLYSLLAFLKFAATVSSYVLPRRHKPYGYACVNFGEPISLRKLEAENKVSINSADKMQRRESVGILGENVANAIKALIPVLPTSLLAVVLKTNNYKPLSELELKTESNRILKLLLDRGISVALPDNDGDYALSQGIYILLRRKIITPTGDGRFEVVTTNIKLLEYYCNTVEDIMSKSLDVLDKK